ncbi:hypothetical protein LSCM1_05753 [Leishmania martiniquensis]|uniref:Uncharacterized protein n=1 Tax=Leishmania martiniquensis TaxID=1580590 RepID=A0A836HSY3_9TRYP|nr:hypothetical protein LSCM1_05753 [Leishmania martiniquensis]
MQQIIPHVVESHTAQLPLMPTAAELLMKGASSEQSRAATMSSLPPVPGATDARRPLLSALEARSGGDVPPGSLHPHATGLQMSGTVDSEGHDVGITSAVVVENGDTAATPGESGETPVGAVPPAAPTPSAAAAEPAVPASSALEPTLAEQLPVTAAGTDAAATSSVKEGPHASSERVSSVRYKSRASTPPTANRNGFRGHGDANGASARAPGHRESLKHLATSRRAPPGTMPVRRRNHFSGCDGVSYENFFFHSEDVATFGIGTVGLFATTAKPVTGAPHTASQDVCASAHRRRIAGEGRHRSAPQLPPALPSCRGSHHPTLGAAGVASTASCYYTPACYASPAVDGVKAWEQRQEDYRNWRCENLLGSTYYRLSNPFDAGGGTGRGAEANDGESSLHDVTGAPALYSAEEIRRIERLRLRGLQAERTARSTARAREHEVYEGEVLLQRVRKLRGEAVDLPDSYLRATYPDPFTLTGYAELETEHAKGRTYPGPYRSKAASGYLASPKRVVHDHHRAMQHHRVAMRQARLDREARRLKAAECQRRDAAAQLTKCRLQQEAYLASWMEGHPRGCCAREVEQRVSNHWNGVTQTREREVGALYTSQEAAAATARQQELRARAGAAPSNSSKGISGGYCLEQEVWLSPSMAAAEYCGAAAQSPHSPSRVPGSSEDASLPPRAAASPVTVVASQAAGEKSPPVARPVTPTLRPVTPTLPPSQVVGPTSTNFCNEVKQWSREFSSPNTVPANGADTAYRRAWRAALSEAQLRFSRDAAQRQRGETVRRVQEAREKAFEGKWKHAERERQEKRELAMRRADHTHADIEAASAIRLEVHEEAHHAQQQRMVQEAERYTETQFLRQQSKQREMVLRSLEATELQQLRVKVSSASGVNRG